MQVCIDNPWILKGWVLWLREDIGINFYYLGRHSKNSIRYFHLTNNSGGWNKRGGEAKIAKSLNVEAGINVEVGKYLWNQ